MVRKSTATESALLAELTRCRTRPMTPRMDSIAKIASRAGVSRASAYRSARFLEAYEAWAAGDARPAIASEEASWGREESIAELKARVIHLEQEVAELLDENNALRTLLLKNS